MVVLRQARGVLRVEVAGVMRRAGGGAVVLDARLFPRDSLTGTRAIRHTD
jgi:hypothetical protein